MAIYQNISVTASTSTSTLIAKNKSKSDKGNIRSILIANSDDTGNQEPTVDIYLDDGSNQYYIIRDIVIPIGTALLASLALLTPSKSNASIIFLCLPA